MNEFIFWNTPHHSLTFSSKDGALLKLSFKGKDININHHIWELTCINSCKSKCKLSPDESFNFTYKQSSENLDLQWESKATRVNVYIYKIDSFTAMKINTSLFSEDYIYSVQFPIIGNLTDFSNDSSVAQLLLPWQNGFLIHNPIKTLLSKTSDIPFWCGRGKRRYENEYPAQYSYQFSAYYSDEMGIYFATQDCDAYIKTIGYYLNDDNTTFNYIMTNYPENMGKCKNYFMPYCFTLGFFKGDWQEAVNLYRPWAIKQKWCVCDLSERNIPENVTKTDLWRINHTNYALGTRTEEYINTCRYFKETLNCNVGMHWYGWNQGRHDYEYPYYINEKLAEWPSELYKYNTLLKEEGFVKIPYVNARLWDSLTPSWDKENVIDSAIKDETGAMPDEPWNSGTVLRPVCPAEKLWREKVVSFGENYVNKFDFDGLYVDQVASYNATLCFDEKHNHPTGGGNWWGNSYLQMMRQLRNTIGENKILTSESCCEIYNDVFNLFLILDTNMQTNVALAGGEFSESIPIFNMLYGKHMLTYGSICLASNTPEQFEFNIIRNTLWGIIPSIDGFSWEEIQAIKSPVYINSLGEAVNYFKNHKDEFIFGRLCQVLYPKCPEMSIEWEQYDGVKYTKKYPTVQAVVWERKDNSKYILAYNFSDVETTVKLLDKDIKLAAHKIISINI